MLKKTAALICAFLLALICAFFFASFGRTAHAQGYTGHDSIPTLRGVNTTASTLSSDLPALTTIGINVIRCEVSYDRNYAGYSASVFNDFTGNGTSGDVTTTELSSTDPSSYRSWLTWEITNSASDLNTTIAYCAAHNIKVLIDVHMSAGGAEPGGVNRIFLYDDCRTEFLYDWSVIAQKYAANPAVWGYDLLNEPNDSSNLVGNWNSAALAVAQKIRAYDSAGGANPTHAVIKEIASGGFAGLTPMTSVAGVVYSFHNGWTGIDVGAANPAVATTISFFPDSSSSGGPALMIGGVFQGSNNGTTWKNLTTQIMTAPTSGVWMTLPVIAANAGAYRYLRYYDNGSGSNYCDVAEVKFNGY